MNKQAETRRLERHESGEVRQLKNEIEKLKLLYRNDGHEGVDDCSVGVASYKEAKASH